MKIAVTLTKSESELLAHAVDMYVKYQEQLNRNIPVENAPVLQFAKSMRDKTMKALRESALHEAKS